MNRQKKSKKLNNSRVTNGGFSLVEVIVSMAILALITIPLLNYFSDSLRRSIMTARRQNATLLAQELTEVMKAEDRLIEKTDAGTYTVVNLPFDPADIINVDDSAFNHTGSNAGKGEFIITAKTDDFDVRVTLSTDSYVNETERSLIRGIDSATDVVILERDQQTEALVYYSAANSEYCAVSGQTPMTQDEIRDNMTRTMYITVVKNASDYTVQAYYVYKCGNLRGAGSTPVEFKSTYLVDIKVTDLQNLFLLYDCIEKSVGGVKNDTIEFTLPDISLGIYMVAQNLPSSGDAYTMHINGCSYPNSKLSYHSNFRSNDYIKVGSSDLDASEKLPLTDKGKPVRVLVITTEVFEAGHVEGDTPLATMQSTKGE